ncbi:MAG: nucleotidyltransferase domain-containing protein [Eubacterium sp.]|nr:nucleotidyltransferase domain-containing protein [Eubacterium sp.]
MQKSFIHKLKEFSMNNNHIECAIIVGSYARGTNTENSDLDICLITTNKKEMIENPDFVKQFGTFSKMQTEYYGACTSIRVWYENSLEAEFGIVEPSWIRLPLDNGTHKVLSDGYKVIVDKKNYFQNLKF